MDFSWILRHLLPLVYSWTHDEAKEQVNKQLEVSQRASYSCRMYRYADWVLAPLTQFRISKQKYLQRSREMTLSALYNAHEIMKY